MDIKQARSLKVGDRVRWRDYDPTHHANEASGGEVVERDYSSFKVRWDDGLEVAYRFVHAETIMRASA